MPQVVVFQRIVTKNSAIVRKLIGNRQHGALAYKLPEHEQKRTRNEFLTTLFTGNAASKKENIDFSKK
ncbi:MAG: hypothetical protein MUC59_09890 [Saprospiraceae bacterium]|jgi:hypothetical protein|nr:hypothetical protein [Saprospiraceae bacterium]